eukprot:TRINITY_DN16625_c0_g1_i2.p1 TRINITY_DN16625_c0_g1~~TRINITY_DN16625_c0_g1_i2.p1  ORF type:complete len:173 (+),score=23.79 TRINITY_DN16625_c0_g1_i2:164-682(+)
MRCSLLLLAIAAALAAPTTPAAGMAISLRTNASVCLDVAGATDQTPIHFATCVASSPTQLFTYDMSHTPQFHIGCAGGFIEDFWSGSDLTVWTDAPWPPTADSEGKIFGYNATTGLVTSMNPANDLSRLRGVPAKSIGAGASNRCLAAVPGGIRTCNANDPLQQWNLHGGPV